MLVPGGRLVVSVPYNPLKSAQVYLRGEVCNGRRGDRVFFEHVYDDELLERRIVEPVGLPLVERIRLGEPGVRLSSFYYSPRGPLRKVRYRLPIGPLFGLAAPRFLRSVPPEATSPTTGTAPPPYSSSPGDDHSAHAAAGGDARTEAPDVLDGPERGPRRSAAARCASLGYAVGTLVTVGSAAALFRHLGVADGGRYVTVMSLMAVVQGLTDAGPDRDRHSRVRGTHTPAERHAFMRHLLGVRVALTVSGVGLAVAFTVLAGYDSTLVSARRLPAWDGVHRPPVGARRAAQRASCGSAG